METMTDTHRTLTTLNPETTAKAEVTLKLESVKTPYQELSIKLGIKILGFIDVLIRTMKTYIDPKIHKSAHGGGKYKQ